MSAVFQTFASNGGSKIIAKHPLTYKRDGSKPACVLAHGFGGSALDAVSDTAGSYRATDAIARAGYPVVAGDNAGTASMGNDAAITAMGSDLTWARSNVGAKATGKHFVAGISMGGLAAMNYARTIPERIAGIILFIFAFDLEWTHDTLDGGAYADDVDAAYTNHAGYIAALPTHNPAQYATTDLAGIPILAFYNSDDPNGGTDLDADFLADMSAVTSVESYTATGGHALTNFDFAPLKKWMDEVA